MASPALRFGVAALATWRVTHLIAAEDGPADVVLRVRRRAGDSLLGDLMDCFACTSVWAAAPFVPAAALSRSRSDRLIALLALSGAACLLERTEPAPLSITNDEDTDELLWEGARGAEGDGDAPAGGESAGVEPVAGVGIAGVGIAGDGIAGGATRASPGFELPRDAASPGSHCGPDASTLGWGARGAATPSGTGAMNAPSPSRPSVEG